MAPGRKRGAEGAKTKSELSLGDLVLAKVKGFPAWPAKISRPENLELTHDPKKYFVNFFGTKEIAFVAPTDIQAFTSESKDKLSVRCQGKTVRYFTQAVKEICEEFEELQCRNLSGVQNYRAQNLASRTSSLDPVVDEALEVNGSNKIERKRTNCKLEFKGPTDLGSGLNRCSQRQGEMKPQDIKPRSSNDMCHNLSPYVSPLKRNKISIDPTNLAKEFVSSCSPANHFHPKEEGFRDTKVEGRYLDSGKKKLTNVHQPKLTLGEKKNPGRSMPRKNCSAVSRKHTGEGMQRKSASGGNIKVSSTDDLRSGLDVGNEKKEKELLIEKKHSEAVDGPQADAELCSEEHANVISRKEMKTQNGREKQTSETTEASCPAKLSKCADTGEDAGMVRAQMNRNNNSRSLDVLNDKMTNIESKRLTSVGKAENRWNFRGQTTTNESNCCTDEYDLPPTKRHRLALEAMTKSALISENKLGNSLSRKNDLVHPNKVQSPVMQLPTKRRAVLLCDDNNEDELPKTPVHGKKTNKVSAIPHVSNSKKKAITHVEDYVPVKLVTRNSATVDDCLKEQVQSARVSNKASSPTAQQSTEKRIREFSAVHVSPSLPQLDSVKLISKEAEPVLIFPKRSPRSTTGTKPSIELQCNQSSKAPGIISEKKAPAVAKRGFATASERSTSSQYQSISERSKPASSGEKRKSSPKSDSRTTHSVHVVGIPDENIASLVQRVDVGKDNKISFPIDSKNLDTVMSMKHLIAAAQARKRKPHIPNSYGNPFPLLVSDADMPGRSPSPSPATLAFESSKTLQIDVQESHPASPNSDVLQLASSNQPENEELEERRVSSSHQATGCSLSGGTEAAVARDAFEGMIETLTRTKESIGRATRLAIDCAKYGMANEVVELLIKKLENEPCFDRRVDLFFLVDSITQCSHSKKGIAGASYLPIVQVALPRLIGAVAPHGAGAKENRRQCHKVLRLWLERKILPDYVLRRYMDAIGTVNDDTSAGFSLRRPSRAERAIDDPIREMEGFFLDEYGSNATFQLPGLPSSHIFEEEDDEDKFTINLCNEVADTSPSKHTPAASRDREDYTVTPSNRRHCILEDVEGELEMEDVSGQQNDGRSSFINGSFEPEPNSDGILESVSNIHAELLSSPEGSPPLPPGSPPLTPPLPTSPPPSPSPPLLLPPSLSSLPPLPPSPQQHLFPQPPAGPPPPDCPPPPVSPPPPDCPPPPAGPPPHACPSPPVGPPPLLSKRLLSHQPALMSQPMSPSLPSTIATSPASPYQPPPLLHEIGDRTTGKRHALLAPNTQRSHFDAYVRSEILSNQPSCFPPARVSNVRNQIGYNLSRPAEYGQGDAYMNPQALRCRQPFMPGGVPVTQRPLHPEPQPSQFSNPNSFYQHQYPPYSLPKFSNSTKRNATDEQWRMQVNESNANFPRGGRMAGYRCDGTRRRYDN